MNWLVLLTKSNCYEEATYLMTAFLFVLFANSQTNDCVQTYGSAYFESISDIELSNGDSLVLFGINVILYHFDRSHRLAKSRWGR